MPIANCLVMHKESDSAVPDCFIRVSDCMNLTQGVWFHYNQHFFLSRIVTTFVKGHLPCTSNLQTLQMMLHKFSMDNATDLKFGQWCI